MSLKITLKPHEKLIIGGAVVTNGDVKNDLIIENTIPILREKDIMTCKEADSPCRRIYLAIQLMYVDEKHITDHHRAYWDLVKGVLRAAPSQRELISNMSEKILYNQYYQALKLARKLIDYEQEVINRVRTSTASL